MALRAHSTVASPDTVANPCIAIAHPVQESCGTTGPYQNAGGVRNICYFPVLPLLVGSPGNLNDLIAVVDVSSEKHLFLRSIRSDNSPIPGEEDDCGFGSSGRCRNPVNKL